MQSAVRFERAKVAAMVARTQIFHVAVPTPLPRAFDYLPPIKGISPSVGTRVRIPFGRRMVVGLVLSSGTHTAIAAERLKHITEVIDEAPLVSSHWLAFLAWAADYYHHPIGEVIQAALPGVLRQGRAASLAGTRRWRITERGADVESALARAPVQKKLLSALRNSGAGLDAAALAGVTPRWASVIRVLVTKGWARVETGDYLPARTAVPSECAPTLNDAQVRALTAITDSLGRFHCFLLHGITGSGKTEVYLHAVAHSIAQGQQALVLVPEIGLTPQLVERFERRFHQPIVVLHSSLSDHERLGAWLAARAGRAAIVLGTRSAVFTPLKRPGLIIVDEEHDTSYKQQDGFRYSARDVAIMRASREQIPIVLGSATPSLESLHKAQGGGYTLLELPERTGSAQLPAVELLDMRRLASLSGLSHPLRMALAQGLARHEQSLLFLNRRGFAPVWMCHGCGWIAPCERCDARLVVHRKSKRLRCHHCGSDRSLPSACPVCRSAELQALGEGTEKIEQALHELYPTARIVRLDRDSTRRKGQLQANLRRIHAGQADILVGTQMISKGHDFPDVTLVGVVNADQGLYSVDFRASERLFQEILQVSGRAGRAAKPGRVLIQTYHPEHPIFSALKSHDYHAFARFALAERRETNYPPFSHAALMRAESPRPGAALAFVRAAHALARRHALTGSVQLGEPLPAPMERRAGRYRAQLLLQAEQRSALHRFLSNWLERLRQDKKARRVRWSVDVDPSDLY